MLKRIRPSWESVVLDIIFSLLTFIFPFALILILPGLAYNLNVLEYNAFCIRHGYDMITSGSIIPSTTFTCEKKIYSGDGSYKWIRSGLFSFEDEKMAYNFSCEVRT